MRVHDITLTHDFSSDDLKHISMDAGRFLSEILLLKPDAVIDAKSLLGMMLSPLKAGFVITIRTKGKDEEEALDFMCEMLDTPLETTVRNPQEMDARQEWQQSDILAH